MKKLVLHTGGHPIVNQDLDHLQNAYLDGLKAIASAFNKGGNCILSGVEDNGTNISAGWVYYGGEIYEVKTQVTPSGTLYLQTNIYTKDPETGTTPFTRTYEDTIVRSVHYYREMVVQNSSGTVLLSSLPRVTQAITAGGLLPIGTLIDWVGVITTGTNFDSNGKGLGVMAGWQICNGNNGSPNLGGKVIVARDLSQVPFNAVGNTGGANTITIASNNLPTHTHTINPHSHRPEIEADTNTGNNVRFKIGAFDTGLNADLFEPVDSGAGVNPTTFPGFAGKDFYKILSSESLTTNTNTTTNTPVSVLQPYYVALKLIRTT